MLKCKGNSRPVAYETNDTAAYNPEIWAQESLMILRNNMVAAQLVHQDFSTEIAEFGDIVNTRRPNDFSAKRKTATDNVTIQDAIATNVVVPLDQHVHTSFLIRDSQMSLAFKNLVTEFLEPAVIAMAQFIDQVVYGASAQWLLNNAYAAGNLGAGATKGGVLETRKIMNTNKAPINIRSLLHSVSSETDLLNIAEVLNADKIGDDGTKMREASLGRLWGFNHWMDQNVGDISAGDNTVGAVDNAAGYAAGTTSLTVDTFAAALTNGSWVTIAGDDVPHRVVSTVGGATPTTLVITPGLKRPVADNAAITVSTAGAVNFGAGYAAGYAKEIVYDTFTIDPQVGQPVAFGDSTDTAVYSILQVDTVAKTILLDRPLVAALADNDPISVANAGSYNFAFHRNALALVLRPLALPDPRTGVRGASASFNGITVRTVMTYDGEKQGHLVTLDLLAGTKVLDNNLGALMFS